MISPLGMKEDFYILDNRDATVVLNINSHGNFQIYSWSIKDTFGDITIVNS